jgi:hypothetical protein
VEGNRAAVGVEFANSGPPGRPAAVIVMEDNGAVSSDRFVVRNLPPGSAPSVCPSPAGVALDPAFGPVPGSTGPGIVVTDVPPRLHMPTAKEQCKHGGYAAFGFKNQGQCIAFVQRGPKPPEPRP